MGARVVVEGVGMDDREQRIASVGALWALIREDLRYNGAVTWPGYQALVVHRFGVWKNGIRSKILRLPLTILYRIAAGFVRNFYGIELPATTRVGRRVLIGHQHGIIIHQNAVIGDDCVLRQGVSIGQDRPTPGQAAATVPAPKLGNGVEVGAGSVIMGNITIGDGVRIGPNAVVMSNVPAGAIVAAAPSRIMASPPTRRPDPDARPADVQPSGTRPSSAQSSEPAAEPAPDAGGADPAQQTGT
jgi:serine O-acetyltransferase